jgi:hypothetical protein
MLRMPLFTVVLVLLAKVNIALTRRNFLRDKNMLFIGVAKDQLLDLFDLGVVESLISLHLAQVRCGFFA